MVELIINNSMNLTSGIISLHNTNNETDVDNDAPVEETEDDDE